MKWEIFKRCVDTAQAIVVIVGLPVAAAGLFYAGRQTQIQADTLQDNQKIQAAQFVLGINSTLNSNQYKDIIAAIEGDDNKPHSSSYPLLKASGGQFTSTDIDTYIGNYDDLGVLYKNDLIDKQMAYDEYSYDVEKAYCNKDVIAHIMKLRKRSGDMNSSHAFYTPFEELARAFMAMDNYQACAPLDDQ